MEMLRTMPKAGTWKRDDEPTSERRFMPTYYMEFNVLSFLELNVTARWRETMLASPSQRKPLPGSCEDSKKILGLSR